MNPIGWCSRTWNPVTGCSAVSPGCDHCYAARVVTRFHTRDAYHGLVSGGQWTGRINLHPERLGAPARWKKPEVIFVGSITDLGHPAIPWSYLAAVFEVMDMCSHHTFIILTKRPGRLAHFAQVVWPRYRNGDCVEDQFLRVAPEVPAAAEAWPRNVWAGVSVESSKYLPRIDVLARVPAPVRLVSCEPLLGRLELNPWLDRCDCWELRLNHFPDGECILDACPCEGFRPVLGWVIVGGESGLGARPMQGSWAQAIVRDCERANVPVWFKQWGGPRQPPKGTEHQISGKVYHERPPLVGAL